MKEFVHRLPAQGRLWELMGASFLYSPVFNKKLSKSMAAIAPIDPPKRRPCCMWLFFHDNFLEKQKLLIALLWIFLYKNLVTILI